MLLDKSIKVFQSEKRLYRKETKVNHRLHSKCQHAEGNLFNKDKNDVKLLYPLLHASFIEMNKKLSQYAKDYLQY